MPGRVASVRRCFAKLEDPHRHRSSVRHTLSDTLSAALAMFSLNYPSQQFDRGVLDDAVVRHDLHTLYGVSQAPCDTQMRSILDPVEPSALRPAFREDPHPPGCESD